MTETLADMSMRSFIHSDRRAIVAQSIADAHPHIPPASHAHIFPLYNPLAVDILVFWQSPFDGRSGHVLRTGLMVGPSHAALQEIIESVENAKVKRSIYAETQREKMEILEAVRQSEWNMEMNPVVVTVEGGVQVTHDFSQGYVCVLTSKVVRDTD
jgi:trafficking protein particle complex subunit 8